MIRNRKIKEIGMLKILRSPPIYLSPHRVSRPDAFFSFKFEAISSTYTVDQIHIWRNDFDVHSYAISTIFFPPLLFSISFFDYPTHSYRLCRYFSCCRSSTRVSLWRMFREDVVLEMERNFSR